MSLTRASLSRSATLVGALTAAGIAFAVTAPATAAAGAQAVLHVSNPTPGLVVQLGPIKLS